MLLNTLRFMALWERLKIAHVAWAVIDFDTADLYYCNTQQ